MGPFKVTGVIMDESESGCWTNHQSVVNYKNQWYLFYHNNNLSPDFDKNRSIRADSLFFNSDGTIKKVLPTERGIGITQANSKIQIDRYSNKTEGIKIHFNDPSNTFDGWYAEIPKDNWVIYNTVEFKEKTNGLVVKALSENGTTLQIRANKKEGNLLAEIKIPKGSDWDEHEVKLKNITAGIKHLYITSTENTAGVDWIKFSN